MKKKSATLWLGFSLVHSTSFAHFCDKEFQKILEPGGNIFSMMERDNSAYRASLEALRENAKFGQFATKALEEFEAGNCEKAFEWVEEIDSKILDEERRKIFELGTKEREADPKILFPKTKTKWPMIGSKCRQAVYQDIKNRYLEEIGSLGKVKYMVKTLQRVIAPSGKVLLAKQAVSMLSRDQVDCGVALNLARMALRGEVTLGAEEKKNRYKKDSEVVSEPCPRGGSGLEAAEAGAIQMRSILKPPTPSKYNIPSRFIKRNPRLKENSSNESLPESPLDSPPDSPGAPKTIKSE